jgi:hypothetical protein
VGVHNILSKTDRALVAYLLSEGVGNSDNVLPGKSAADNPSMPFVVCMSPTCRPTVPFSGNWTVQTEIEIHTSAAPDKDEDTDTMKEESDDLAAQVFDALMRLQEGDQSGSSLADDISAAAHGAGVDYTATDVMIGEMEQGNTEKSGEWVDKLTITVTCIPRTI